jgi:hypothetical protein
VSLSLPPSSSAIGDAIDAPTGFLDAEGMFAFDLQSAAA